MRRIKYILVTCILFMVMLSGCGGHKSLDNGKLNVVTTIFAPYDFVRQIAGEQVNLKMLLKPGEESHSYEPSPKDIIAISECDIFIYVGGENDAWIDHILHSIDTSRMRILKLIDMVDDKYEEESVEGMDGVDKHHHEHDEDEHEEWDEHVWTSPVNAVTICEKITQVLCAKDSDNSDTYLNNCSKYTEELKTLDESFRNVISNAKRNMLVFGDRFPLRYFVEEYGLDYYAAFPGCAAESEASAATIAFLTDMVEDNNIPVVFKIELSNAGMANAIAEDSGCKVFTFYTCHNLSVKDFEEGETYVSLMNRNVDAIKEALN